MEFLAVLVVLLFYGWVIEQFVKSVNSLITFLRTSVTPRLPGAARVGLMSLVCMIIVAPSAHLTYNLLSRDVVSPLDTFLASSITLFAVSSCLWLLDATSFISLRYPWLPRALFVSVIAASIGALLRILEKLT